MLQMYFNATNAASSVKLSDRLNGAGKSACATLKVDKSSNNKTIFRVITTWTLQEKSILPNLLRVQNIEMLYINLFFILIYLKHSKF